jgi:hypothetical protein
MGAISPHLLVFFEGCFGKSGVQRVVFCGEVVVKCVAKVDKKMSLFGR